MSKICSHLHILEWRWIWIQSASELFPTGCHVGVLVERPNSM